MKVLIIRFSSIGDIVLTTPVVRCLKNQLDHVEIHYASKQSFVSFLAPNPNIDKLHLLAEDERAFIEALKKEQFDYVIDLHHNLRTLRIKRALKAKTFSFDKLNFKKALLVNFKINKMPDRHIVDRYMDTVSSLGVVNDDKGLDYFIPEKDEVSIAQFLPQTFGDGYASFVIGGQHQTKKLPTHKLIELCAQIAVPVVLLGGKEDVSESEKIEKHFEGTGKIYNAVGQINLNQSASLVRQSNIVYTHDTGLMHIAAAFQKKVVAIWGNTVPEFGMYPYQTEYVNMEVKDLSCRPCSKIGYDKCPKGHFKCMENQKNDTI